MRKGLTGTLRRSGGTAAAVAVLVMLVYIAGHSIAASFTSSEHAQPVLISGTVRTLNISVNNTHPTNNMSRVVLSFPRIDASTPSFIFINDTNQTSAFGPNFTVQYRTIAPNDVQNLSWENKTLQGIVGSNGTIAYFTFKAYMPRTAGTYNITVYTYDNGSVINATNVTLAFAGLTSTLGNFSTHTEEVRFNWTNSSIRLESNMNKTLLYADTLYTNITPIYFATSSYAENTYAQLTSTNRLKCFNVDNDFGLEIEAENVSAGQAGLLNTTGLLNETNQTHFTLRLANTFCPPGLYKGTFAVRNASGDGSDRIHIPASIHIPISINNTLLESSKSGYFKGTNTSQTTQSFYFRTNLTENITAVTVNLSGLSTNPDMFLLTEGGSLLEKSVNTGDSSEEIFRFLTTPEVWEIRLANTIQSITGYVHFSTINVTNTSETNTSLRSLAFGSSPLSPNDTNSTDFRLANEDTAEVNNVRESIEVYNIKRFQNQSAEATYWFFVPSYATKVKARLQWDNYSSTVTDWDLFLEDNTGRFISNSTDASATANSTNIEREEHVTYAGPFNHTYEGLWNATVMNMTNDTVKSPYNLSVLVYFSPAAWTNSSFNQSTDFNTTGGLNSSFNVTFKATVPRHNVTNGTYEGHVTYYNGSGWKVRLPFSFQVNASHLFINNNLSSTTMQKKANIGSHTSLFLNITYNNTGGSSIYFTNTTSNLTLYLESDNNKNVSFSLDGMAANPILTGQGGTINITLDINTTLTTNTAGIYRGWLLLNTTNATISSSSYPYETFNVTIELNLTDRLNATIKKLVSGYANMVRVENASKENNITLDMDVRLMNGSTISKGSVMGIGDFFSPSVMERNVTSYSVTPTDLAAAGGSLCDTDTCNLNVTLPANMVGGQYSVFLNARWNTSQSNLTGTALNTTLLVNNTGINMSAPQALALGNVNEATGTQYINVTAGNLGPLDAIQASFTLNTGSCPVTVTRETSGAFSSGCSGISSSGSGATFSATLNKYTPIEGGCALRWKLTAQNVSSNTACTFNVTANRASFNNITGITLTVVNTASSSGDDTGSGSGSTTTCSSDSDCTSTQYCSGSTCTALSCASHEYISNHACVAYAPNLTSYEDNISFTHGSSTSTDVWVNELNNKTILAALNITISNELNYTISPATCFTKCRFNVTFATKNTTQVKAYSGTYKVFHSSLPAAYQIKSFTVKVLPTEEQKGEIDQKFTDYLADIEGAKQRFESLKIGLSDGNLTLLNSLFSSLDNLSASIQAALGSGDYTTANTLMDDLNATLSQIDSTLASAGQGAAAGMDILTWIVVGVVIAGVAIFLVYLLLPPKRGYGSSGFRPGGKKGFLESLKGRFRRTRNKLKKPAESGGHKINKYTGGYEKHKPFFYRKKKENPIKRLIKKKQRKLKEFSK